MGTHLLLISTKTEFMKGLTKRKNLYKLFKLVMKEKNHKLTLPKAIFPNTYPLRYIKAVKWHSCKDLENENDEKETEVWNKYILESNEAIGVKTYCEFVYAPTGGVVGLLSFRNNARHEVKTKYIRKWKKVFKKVQNHVVAKSEMIIIRKPSAQGLLAGEVTTTTIK